MLPQEGIIRRQTERAIREMGDSTGVSHFLNKYGKATTKRIYALSLSYYIRWLKEKGVAMTPDELLTDNLKCVYESAATDVRTKRKHTDWLEEYVNRRLMEMGLAQSTRLTTAAAIQQFYKRNDSPLFGDFQVSTQQMAAPPKQLDPADIRGVLRALTPYLRTPLLCLWQSGVEINQPHPVVELGNASGPRSRRVPAETRILREEEAHQIVLHLPRKGRD